ncbi:MAG: galactokinase [Actinomycetota bacterium]|nr:galactokinase [Actinomycetota bacterium]
MTATTLFGERFGRTPDGLWSAPGRVNLIGEHTDYNNGMVLPFAIDARAELAAGTVDEPVIRIVTAQRPGAIVEAPLAVLSPGSAAATGWPAYIFGAAWALNEAGIEVSGAELALDSAVPVGAGLSSSAAIECATALALTGLAGVHLTPSDLARLCQRAENAFVGVPSGLMDQMASAACRKGNLLFFDIGADSTEHIPFQPEESGLQMLTVDTKAHHSLADGEYAKRRASCEQAAELLGLNSLRDIDNLPSALAVLGTTSAFDATERAVLVRRVRHVVTENARVLAVVRRLRTPGCDWAAVGADLTASHVSLRDDYQVSSVELDTAVDAALSAGALGARMTGAGFGGSTIALVPVERVNDVTTKVESAFAAADFAVPAIRLVSPANGAGRDS